eukprot:5768729-Prymnesium_polylepis.1
MTSATLSVVSCSVSGIIPGARAALPGWSENGRRASHQTSNSLASRVGLAQAREHEGESATPTLGEKANALPESRIATARVDMRLRS